MHIYFNAYHFWKDIFWFSLFIAHNDTTINHSVTWSSIITIPGKYFENNESGFITINGPGGVEISLDNIKVHLPPAGHYPNPDAVCDELIVNGDNSKSQLFTYPLFSFDLAESLRMDVNGNYMTMDVRGHDTSELINIGGIIKEEGGKLRIASKLQGERCKNTKFRDKKRRV